MPAYFARLSPNLRGALFLLLGIAVFSGQDLILKLLSGSYPLHEAMFFRSIAAVPCLLILAHYDGGIAALRSPGWARMMSRGVLNFGAYTCYYLALASLPIATTMTLYFTAPLFIVILSILMLGERVTPVRWVALIAGFVGVLVIIRPGGTVFLWAMLLPVAAGIFYAFVQIMTGRMGQSETAPAMSFYSNLVFFIGAVLLSLVFGSGVFESSDDASLAFLTRGWITPSLRDLALMGTCGAIAAIGLTLLTQAYRTAEVNYAAPFEYSMLLWGVLFDWLFWQHLPDTATWAGIAILVVAGLLLLLQRRPTAIAGALPDPGS